MEESAIAEAKRPDTPTVTTEKAPAPETSPTNRSQTESASEAGDISNNEETTDDTEDSSEGNGASTEDSPKVSGSSTAVSEVDFAQSTAQVNHTVAPHIRIHPRSPLPHMVMSQSFTSTESEDNASPSFPPRGPRALNGPRWPQRMDIENELSRTKARLMKALSDLDTERSKNRKMHKDVETQLHQKMDAALSHMLKDLFHSQVELLQQKTELQENEIEFQYRNRDIEQLEIFLSEGQKQLVYQFDKQGTRTMNNVELEFARRQAMIDIDKQYAVRDHQLDVKMNRLKIREEALQLREQKHQLIFRDAVEVEMRKILEPEIEDRVAKEQYERGFQAGKEAGDAEKREENQQSGFMEGYTSGLRTQKTLLDLRNGKIAPDSPELNFLFDLNHPNHLFSRGMQAATSHLRAKPEDVNLIDLH